MRTLTVVALVVSLAASCLMLVSCTKPEDVASTPSAVTPAPPTPAAPEGTEADEPEPAGDTGEPGAPVDEDSDADDAPADAEAADAIVEEVGAPLYEGAELGSVEIDGDTKKAVYDTEAEYDTVNEFYAGELAEPDWSNNGFEAGPFGGDVWEYKSADGTKLVTIDSESEVSTTEVTFTVQPAEE